MKIRRNPQLRILLLTRIFFFQVYSILCIVSLYKYSKDSSGGANTVIDYESANSYPLNIIRSAILTYFWNARFYWNAFFVENILNLYHLTYNWRIVFCNFKRNKPPVWSFKQTILVCFFFLMINSIYLSIYLSIHLSIYPFIFSFIYLSVYLSIYLFVYLSICLCISISA